MASLRTVISIFIVLFLAVTAESFAVDLDDINCTALLLPKGGLNLKNIVIVTAMDIEHDAIVSTRQVEGSALSEKLGLRINQFTVNDINFFILRSGVGGVNAALSLGFAIDRHPIDAVFVIGVGGALVPELGIGDLVIADSVVQHDSVYSGESGDELMSPGELFLSRTVENAFSDPVMRTHPELTALLERAFTGRGSRVFRGPIVSGGEFVANATRKTALSQRHQGALLVDMEAAAVAQVCRKMGIPFVVAKTVADRLNPDGSISSDYKTFLKSASERAAQIIDLLFSTQSLP